MAKPKLSKSDANYGKGTNAEHCGICTMFRRPDECTAVAGIIRASDRCKLFEKKPQAAKSTITLTDNWDNSPFNT